MLKTIIKKFSIYRKKKIRTNILLNKKTLSIQPNAIRLLGACRKKKIKNTFNPFAYNKSSSGIVDIISSFLNMTPEEEEASMQRVMNMVKLMANPYTQEKINDSVSKFKHISKSEDYYYEVHKVRMTEEQYQQYLDKKALNEKLYKKLPLREKEKRVKL